MRVVDSPVLPLEDLGRWAQALNSVIFITTSALPPHSPVLHESRNGRDSDEAASEPQFINCEARIIAAHCRHAGDREHAIPPHLPNCADDFRCVIALLEWLHHATQLGACGRLAGH